MNITRQVFYEGRVQGVGFRATVKNLARGYDVTGNVRNLQDGRVELWVQGEAGEVAEFLQAIEESEVKGHIKKTEVHNATDAKSFRGFEISL